MPRKGDRLNGASDGTRANAPLQGGIDDGRTMARKSAKPKASIGLETSIRVPTAADKRLPLLRLQGVERLLCIGAQPSDIAVGAGGMINELIRSTPALKIWWSTFGCEVPVAAREARTMAKLFLEGASQSKLTVHGFRDRFMPFHGDQVRETLEEMAKAFRPDLVLTSGGNGHSDHAILGGIARDVWLDAAVLQYEVLGERSSTGQANVFLALRSKPVRGKSSA